MSDNPLGIIDPLTDTGEQRALDETPSPHALQEALNEGATVGYVQRYVHTHQRWCPALRVLRRWSVLACVLLGALLTLNTIGWFTAKSVFKEVVAAGVRAELKEAVRVEVREALKELGVIHAQLKEIENDSILVSR
jgi:hypothetical protein